MNLKFLILTFFLLYVITKTAHIIATPTTPPPPPYTPPPPPSLPSLQGSESPISIISWNGVYFLIGTYEGQIIKYDGKHFSLLKDFKTPISDIVWSGKQWLIGGLNLLAVYDGKDFKKINEEEVTSINCNEKRCIIYSPRLLIHERDEFMDFDTKIEKFLGVDDPQIKYVLNRDYVFVLTESKIIKYDGNSFLSEDLPFEFEGFDVRYFEWNGQYWLFGGIKSKEAVLFRYDGNIFTKVSYPKDVFSISGGNVPKEYVIPTMIAWNGEYWLIDTGYSIVMYDGSHFQKIEYNTMSPYSPFRINDMVWNGGYWLLLYDLAGTDGSGLARFKDNELKWLSFMQSPQWTPVGSTSWTGNDQWYRISKISWNGSYWLVGIAYINYPRWERRMVLVEYDGNAFRDLTENFNEAFLSQESVTPQPQKSGISILFFTICLISILILLRHRFKNNEMHSK